tara:strand:- start:546 stop:833 length:288 start_codon:yes stop_codon:yes gene_type:complete
MQEWLGYMGVAFATIYRIPQIMKICKTKKGDDVSKKSFLLHNGAYISFILYLIYGRKEIDTILMVYYVIGMIQNLTIVGLKKYYKREALENPSFS